MNPEDIFRYLFSFLNTIDVIFSKLNIIAACTMIVMVGIIFVRSGLTISNPSTQGLSAGTVEALMYWALWSIMIVVIYELVAEPGKNYWIIACTHIAGCIFLIAATIRLLSIDESPVFLKALHDTQNFRVFIWGSCMVSCASMYLFGRHVFENWTPGRIMLSIFSLIFSVGVFIGLGYLLSRKYVHIKGLIRVVFYSYSVLQLPAHIVFLMLPKQFATLESFTIGLLGIGKLAFVAILGMIVLSDQRDTADDETRIIRKIKSVLSVATIITTILFIVIRLAILAKSPSTH